MGFRLVNERGRFKYKEFSDPDVIGLKLLGEVIKRMGKEVVRLRMVDNTYVGVVVHGVLDEKDRTFINGELVQKGYVCSFGEHGEYTVITFKEYS